MKDFIKWLGVNEKVAKVAVWMLIIMVFLIITNTMLESIGFSHYQITYENLQQIPANTIFNYISNWIIIILNFYSIALLTFRIKEIRKLIKYSVLYLLLNIIITIVFDEALVQIFILIFFIIFSYLFSHKNYKYILYIIGSLVINAIIQSITYIYKIQFINYTTASEMTKMILSLDYFIIMAIIILVKEIYLKKRSDKKWDTVGFGLENSTKKANSLKKSQKKQAA